MANTAEMRRLMVHAADLLAKQDGNVREAFKDQHAHAGCDGATYTPEYALDPLAELWVFVFANNGDFDAEGYANLEDY